MGMLQIEYYFRSKWFNLGWSVISLSLAFIIIKREKEITNQPRLKSFWPKIKLTCNRYIKHFWEHEITLIVTVIQCSTRSKCQAGTHWCNTCIWNIIFSSYCHCINPVCTTVNANNNNDDNINKNNNNNNSNRFINKLIYNDIKVSCHQYYYFTWNEKSWLGARCRDLSTKMIEMMYRMVNWLWQRC